MKVLQIDDSYVKKSTFSLPAMLASPTAEADADRVSPSRRSLSMASALPLHTADLRASKEEERVNPGVSKGGANFKGQSNRL